MPVVLDVSVSIGVFGFWCVYVCVCVSLLLLFVVLLVCVGVPSIGICEIIVFMMQGWRGPTDFGLALGV